MLTIAYTDFYKGQLSVQLVTYEDDGEQYGVRDVFIFSGPEEVKKGAEELSALLDLENHIVVGHGFIERIAYGIGLELTEKRQQKIIDTLVLSRLVYPDREALDWPIVKAGNLSPGLAGLHCLESWEQRLHHKISNRLDLTEYIYKHLMKNVRSIKSAELEHRIAYLAREITENGIEYDVKEAQKESLRLAMRQADVKLKILDCVPYVLDKGRKVDYSTTSKNHFEFVLKKQYRYDIPDECYGKDNKIKVSADTFNRIMSDPKASEELKKFISILSEYHGLQKKINVLTDGKGSYLSHVEDGKIHGKINPNGAITGRASHSSPNIAQVPKEYRRLFGPPKGWVEVGADIKGLELRCLAHYLARYDDTLARKIESTEDIHEENRKALGLKTREEAKALVYCLIYGGKAEGFEKLIEGMPGLKQLNECLKNSLIVSEGPHGKIEWRRKWIKGLDGRRLPVMSLRTALNLLLQSAGAIISKKWMVTWKQKMHAAGYTESDYRFIAWVHDEGQVACRNQEIAEDCGRLAKEAIRETKDYFNFRLTLDVETKTGTNWAECH